MNRIFPSGISVAWIGAAYHPVSVRHVTFELQASWGGGAGDGDESSESPHPVQRSGSRSGGDSSFR